MWSSLFTSPTPDVTPQQNDVIAVGKSIATKTEVVEIKHRRLDASTDMEVDVTPLQLEELNTERSANKRHSVSRLFLIAI